MELLIAVGFALVAIGFLLLLLLTIVSVLRGGEAQIRKGAVIMIGPLPIVLADDPHTAKTLMVLALILVVAWFLVVFLAGRM